MLTEVPRSVLPLRLMLINVESLRRFITTKPMFMFSKLIYCIPRATVALSHVMILLPRS